MRGCEVKSSTLEIDEGCETYHIALERKGSMHHDRAEDHRSHLEVRCLNLENKSV